MNRTELIQICEDAVVSYLYWQDRDSYSAQVNIQTMYRCLTAGLDYELSLDGGDSIRLDFYNIDFDAFDLGDHLCISDLDDYFSEIDPYHETEMFSCTGVDRSSDFISGYLPTRERLDRCEGRDWY